MLVKNQSGQHCLYECRIGHRRFVPKDHSFAYGSYMFFIDIFALNNLRGPLVGVNRFNLFSFYEDDHLKGLPGLTLKDRFLNYFNSFEPDLAGTHQLSKVMLLTYPRLFGYVFNPVSFYFAYAKSGRVIFSLAEVSNTFGEMKLYPLKAAGELFENICPKFFYVSPYGELTDLFAFKVFCPAESLAISVDTLCARDNSRILAANLSGQRLPFDLPNLLRLFFRYPLVTLKVILAIHLEAFRLLIKQTPFKMKGADLHLQKEILNSVQSASGKKPISTTRNSFSVSDSVAAKSSSSGDFK